MTAVVPASETLATGGELPGWYIVADLTPPELVVLRRVAVLRRRVLLGLVAVVALCIATYALAFVGHSRAAAESNAADDETAGLLRSTRTYAPITQAESAIARLDTQVASVMAADVDAPSVLAEIRSALPASMSLTQVSLVLDTSDPTAGTDGLQATGRPTIGTLTISGSGRSIDDLPAFIDRLSQVTGLVDVLPTSNQVVDGATQFSLTASLTDQLRSHRYDVAGSKP